MHTKQEHVDILNYFSDTVCNTWIFLFCIQRSCFIYWNGTCFDAVLFPISTSYSQWNESIRWGSIREPCI